MPIQQRTLDSIKKLRGKVVKALKDADIDGIGQNVFSARMEKAWPEESAFVCVYTPETNFDDKRTSPRYYYATGSLVIDVYARGETSNPDDPSTIDDVNDFLDDTSKKIVEVLQPVELRTGPFGGLVRNLLLRSFTNNLSSSGEAERGSQRIVFQVEYAVTITLGGAKDEFMKAKNTLQMGRGSGNSQIFETNVRNG